MKKRHNSKRGFSLIELLVVIAIIGLLASVVLASFSTVQFKAHDARRISEIQSVQKALELYYIGHGHYPDAHVWSCGWDVGNATHSFMVIPGMSANFAGGVPPVDIFKDGDCDGYRYYRYPAGTYGCPAERGAYYVLGITDLEAVSWPSPSSPGWSCPGRNWQPEFDWVTGAFEN